MLSSSGASPVRRSDPSHRTMSQDPAGCEAIRAHLFEYSDGMLPDADPARAAVEEHIAECPACALLLFQCRALRERLHRTGRAIASGERASAALRARIRALLD